MPARECGRAPRCGEDYQNRISGPVLDRIDLTVEVQPAVGRRTGTRAARAKPPRPSRPALPGHEWRKPRDRTATAPSAMPRLDPGDLALTPDAQALAEQAMDRLRLSPRGYTRVLRVSRSIADLAGAAVIGRVHVAEALAFRHRMPGRKLLAAH